MKKKSFAVMSQESVDILVEATHSDKPIFMATTDGIPMKGQGFRGKYARFSSTGSATCYTCPVSEVEKVDHIGDNIYLVTTRDVIYICACYMERFSNDTKFTLLTSCSVPKLGEMFKCDSIVAGPKAHLSFWRYYMTLIINEVHHIGRNLYWFTTYEGVYIVDVFQHERRPNEENTK